MIKRGPSSLLLLIPLVTMLATPTLFADAPPSFLVRQGHEAALSLPGIQRTERLGDRIQEESPLTFALNGQSLSYQVQGIQLVGNLLQINEAGLRLGFDEVKINNILIIEIPETVVRKVRKEKTVFGRRVVYDEPVVETHKKRVRQETILFIFKSPAVEVFKKPGTGPFSLSLPSSIPVSIDGAGKVSFAAPAALTAGIRQSVDTAFSNSNLDRALDYRLENVPKPLDAFLRKKIEADKTSLYESLRATLRREVDNPAFLRSLEREMTRQLPPFAFQGERLQAILVLTSTHLTILTPDARKIDQWMTGKSRMMVAMNASALNLAAGAAWTGFHLSAATDQSRSEWSELFGSFLGTTVDARQLGDIELQRPQTKGEGNEVAVEAGHNRIYLPVDLIAHSRTAPDQPLRASIALTFSIDPKGALALERLESRKSGDVSKLLPGGPANPIAAGFKQSLLRMFLSQRLSQVQEEATRDHRALGFRYIIPETEELDPGEPYLAVRVLP